MSYEKIAFLRVSTWAEATPSASHYYGRLRFDCDGLAAEGEIELKHAMTAEQAKQRDRDDRRGDYRGPPVWEEGDETNAFWSYDDLVVKAIEVCKEKFPDAVLLLEGSGMEHSPCPALYAKDERVQARANELNDEHEQCWDLDEDGREVEIADYRAVEDEWDKLIESLGA